MSRPPPPSAAGGGGLSGERPGGLEQSSAPVWPAEKAGQLLCSVGSSAAEAQLAGQAASYVIRPIAPRYK